MQAAFVVCFVTGLYLVTSQYPVTVSVNFLLKAKYYLFVRNCLIFSYIIKLRELLFTLIFIIVRSNVMLLGFYLLNFFIFLLELLKKFPIIQRVWEGDLEVKYLIFTEN